MQRTDARILLALLLVGGLVYGWHVHTETQRARRKDDAAFCAKNLEYYERVCATFPANCVEGPRKLAKCEP